VILSKVFYDCSQSLQEIRSPGTILKVRPEPLYPLAFELFLHQLCYHSTAYSELLAKLLSELWQTPKQIRQ
jgi:hypothetical protein